MKMLFIGVNVLINMEAMSLCVKGIAWIMQERTARDWNQLLPDIPDITSLVKFKNYLS